MDTLALKDAENFRLVVFIFRLVKLIIFTLTNGLNNGEYYIEPDWPIS